MYQIFNKMLFGVSKSGAAMVENTAQIGENTTEVLKNLSQGTVKTSEAVVNTTGTIEHATKAVEKSSKAVSDVIGYVGDMVERREKMAKANTDMKVEQKKTQLEKFKIDNQTELKEIAADAEQQIKESENALKRKIQESENMTKLDMQKNKNMTEEVMRTKNLEHDAAMEALKAVQEQRVEIARIKATNELKNKQLIQEKEEIKLLNESNLSTSLIARKVNAIFFNEVCRAFGFQRSNKKYYYLGGEPPSSYFSSSTTFYFPTQCTINDEGTQALFLEREPSTDKIPNPVLKIINTNYIIRPAYYFDHNGDFPSTQNVFERSKKDANKPENETETVNTDKKNEYTETLIENIKVTFTAFTTGKFSYPSAIRNIKGGKTRKKNKRKHNKRTKKNRKSKRNTRRRKK